MKLRRTQVTPLLNSRGHQRQTRQRRERRRQMMLEQLETRQVLSASFPLNALSWTNLGPAPILNGQTPGSQNVSGRIAALAAHPTDAGTLYAAAAGGGVWKTTDGGTVWLPLTDNQETLFMGAVAVAPSDPETIYAGTGEAANSALSYYGRGILKSVDGGGTWSLLPGNLGLNEFDRHSVAQIVVHTTDRDTVYVALTGNGTNGLTGNTGIWKTTDGGLSWSNTTLASGLSVDDAYSDVVLDPTSPETLYAAIGTANGGAANGVYKTTDGGGTWTAAGDFPLGAVAADVGRIRLALAPSSPGTVYASIVNDTDSPAEAGDGSLYKLLKTTDAGTTWSDLTGVRNYVGNQGWYDSTLIVSPTNADDVFAGGAAGVDSFLHSSDGGITWDDLSVGADGNGPHVDHHAICFDAAGRLIDGNYGGVWRLDNATVGSVQWTNLTGDLGVTQFIGIALHPTDPDIAYGAAQDNGTNRFMDDVRWDHLASGDGGYVRIDRTNLATLYHTFDYGPGFIERSDDGGATWLDKTSGINTAEPANFYAPFIMDPADSSRLLTGTDRVYQTTDRADTWTAISAPMTNGWNSTDNVDAIAVAPSDANTIYASAGGKIFGTTDRGATWSDRSLLGVAGRVGDLIVDPVHSQTLWAVRRVFGDGHVWKTTDGGANWGDLSGDLPDLPVFSIELDTRPVTNDLLYVGTDQGVYASNGVSGYWTRFGEGLPNAQAADIELNADLNILAVGTHGRGMWQILAAPSADPFEPNATRLAARELGVIPGVHLRDVSLHQTGATLDEDWYQFELLRGDSLDFTVTFPRALADVDLEVTDANGNQLGIAATGVTNSETVSLAGLSDGTYYVRVSGNGPTHYDLSIDPGAGSTTRVIYVNDTATANDVYATAIGDDANDGLSPSQPKATLLSVLTDLDLSGTDLIVLDTGDYGDNVTIAVDDEGAAYAGTVSGSHFNTGGFISLSDADFNVFYLLQFTGGGIQAQGDGVNDSVDNLIRRNRFIDSSPAIQIFHGNGDLLLDNTIEGTGNDGVRFPTGGSATLRGNTISNRTYGVYASGDTNLTIATGNRFANNDDGVYLADGTADISGSTFVGNVRGVSVSQSVTDASIHGNDFDANETGVRSDASVIEVFNNTIHGSTVAGISGVGTFGGESWDAGQANDIHHNAIGIQQESGATVRFNRIHHNQVGVRVDGQSFWNPVSIHHNVIYRNASRGIHVTQAPAVDILHNTIYATGVNADAVRIDGESQNVTHKNNILWTDGGYDLWVDTDSQQGFVSDYNNLFKTGTGKLVRWQKDFTDLFDWQVEADYDSHSIGSTSLHPTLDNPTFVNLAAEDYRLVSAVSTSIDAADPASVFALEPGPNGGRANLGAYGNTAQAASSRPAYLEVDYPNYYTDWEEAEAGVILWRAFNVTGLVDIDLYSDVGVFLNHITTTDVTTGAFGWDPQDSGITGSTSSRYRIRVTSQTNAAATDQSREPFSVPPPVHDFTGDNNNDHYANDGSTTNDEYTTAVGSNRNTGTSPGDPKAVLLSLLRAYDLGPGDTVRVDTGNYVHVRNVVISGNAGVGDDEGLTVTGPTNLARTAQIDRANPFPGSTNLELNDGDFVTLRNLTFTGAEMGVWVHNGSTNLLGENLTFTDNTLDGLFVETDSENSSLDRLTAFDNGRHGIAIATSISRLTHSLAHHNGETGIFLQTSVNTRLENNEAHHNRLGISVSSNSPSLLAVLGNANLTLELGNNIHDNTIGVLASGKVLVAGNVVRDNIAEGIQLDSGAAAQRNVVFSNESGIVQISGCATGDVLENRVYHNTSTGIRLMGTSEARGNVVFSNEVGILGTASSCSSNVPFTGTVKNNLVYANASGGVTLTGANGADAASNTIYQPAGTAVSVRDNSQDVALTNNIVWAISGYGIVVDNSSQVGFASNFNDWFVNGPGHVGRWQDLDRTTLAKWRAASFSDRDSLSRDPLFVDLDGADNALGWVAGTNRGDDDDFHLQSLHGSFHGGSLAPAFSPSTGLPAFLVAAETTDSFQSPLIDRGDAASAFANEPAPNGGYINIGAFGNTPQASKSPAEYVRVLQPDGGEKWPQGQTFTIRWRSHDPNSVVDIDLMRDGIPAPVLNIADDSSNDGEFSWTVPGTIAAASDYRIVVRRQDSGVADASDATFTITPPISVYYVNDNTLLAGDWTDAAGDDANDGLDPLTPKATIRSVLETYDLGPNDLIKVDNGVYNLTVDIPIEPNDSGVTIEGFHNVLFPTRHALLNRDNISPGSYVFDLRGADDVTLDHLHLTGAWVGINLADNAESDRLTVSRNTIFAMASTGIDAGANNESAHIAFNQVSDSGIGIFAINNDATIESNQAFLNGTGFQLTNGPVGRANIAHDNETGFEVSDGARLYDNNEAYDNATGIRLTHAQVSDSIVHDNRVGITVDNCFTGSSVVSGNYVYHNAEVGIVVHHDAEVRDNVVHSNPVGIRGEGVYCFGLIPYSGRIANNVSYANTQQAILLTLADGATVENNTVYLTTGDGIRMEDNSRDVTLRNNILRADGGYAISVAPDSESGFDSDYNDLFVTGTGILGRWEDADFTLRPEWFYELGLDRNSLTADPDFVDLDGIDNRLGFVEGSLTASYFDNPDLIGSPVVTRTEPMVDVDWGNESPALGLPEDAFSVRWEGLVYLPVAGDYTFYSQANDGERLFLDNNPVPGIDEWLPDDGMEQAYLAAGLTAGWHPIRYEVYDDTGSASARLSWSSPTTAKRPIPSRFFRASLLSVSPGDYGADDQLTVNGGSPTIDAGDPRSGYISEPEPNGRLVNLGHTGDRPSATVSDPEVLRVLAPNGLEKLEIGQTVEVQWHSDGLPASTSYEDAVLADSPLAYYRLDELAGNVSSDSSGNLLDAMYSPAPLLNQPGALVDLANRAVRLNGTDSHIQLPSGYEDFSGGLTLEVWVYPTMRDGFQPFIELGNGDGQDSILLGRSDNSNALHFLGIEVPNAVELHRWQHFVGVVDSEGNATLYKNGLPIGEDLTAQPTVVTRTQNYLGLRPGVTNAMFGGLLDEAALYDHPLSAAQVRAHFDAGVIAGLVDIDLVRASDGSFVRSIAEDTPNDGSFGWTIPVDLVLGNDYAVRVKSDSGSSPEDVSNGPFLIAPDGTDYFINDGVTAGDEFTMAIGSNANDGKSPNAPMRSLHALVNAYDLDSGDVVQVNTGTYRVYRELLLGQSDSGVLIGGPINSRALLQRGNQNSERYVFQLTGADDVIIHSLSLAGAQDGIHADTGGSSMGLWLLNNELFDHSQHGANIDYSSLEPIVSSNRIHDVGGTGIASQADDSVIDSNTIWNTATAILLQADDSTVSRNTVYGNVEGISVSNFIPFSTQVTNNTAHDNQTGFTIAGNAVVRHNSAYGNLSAGILVHGVALIDANEVWDNFDGINSTCDSTIVNNHVYHNRNFGIVMGGAGVVRDNVVYDNSVGILGQACTNFVGFIGEIANNLVYDNANQGIIISGARQGGAVVNNTVVQAIGDAIRVQDGSSGVSSRNNILTTSAGFNITVTPDSELDFASDYNNLFVTGAGKVGRWEDIELATRTAWSLELGVDQHSLSLDPQFTDVDGADGILGFSEVPIGSAIIIDDGDVGFATSGLWSSSAEGLGGDALEVPSGDGESAATWTFSGLIAGATYRVAATWVPGPGLAGDVEYQLLDQGRVTALEKVNESSNPVGFTDAGAEWQTLAFARVVGTQLVVRLDNRATSGVLVRADAIRLQRIHGDGGQDDNFRVSASSPTIDAGDPRDYYLSEPQPNGERVNQGVHGNRPLAAPSLPTVQLLAPNGFEKLEDGQATNITWRESGLRSEQFVALINTGGATIDNWLFDEYETSVGTSPSTEPSSVDLSAVSNPAPTAVYQDLRSAVYGFGDQLSYRLPVPDGSYTVRLHFVEPLETEVGARVFDVFVQGAMVLDDFDIVDVTGDRLRAVTRTILATAVAGGGLEIDFVNETDNPAVLAAIEVTTLGVGGLPAATVNLELSTNNGTSWSPLESNLGMDRFGRGSFAWTAGPVTSGSTALVRVTANGAGAPSDRSDDPFMIVPATNHFYLNDSTVAGTVFTAPGNNLNDGKSGATPMYSLRALLAAYDVDLGDIIHVDAGTYRLVREAELPNEDSGVLIEGPSTSVAVFDRGNLNFGPAVIRLTGADDVTIDRLAITGARFGIWADSQADSDRLSVSNSDLHHLSAAAILLENGNDGARLIGNTTRDSSTGIEIYGSGDVVRQNLAFRNHVGIRVDGDGALVEENQTFDNGSIGISASNYSGVQPINVVRNLSHDNGDGIYAEGHVVVADNSAYLNSGTGIVVTDADVTRNLVYENRLGINATGCNVDHTVSHNRVWNNDEVGIALQSNGNAVGNQIYDNSVGIAAGPCGFQFNVAGTIANNLVYDNSNFGVIVSLAILGMRITNNTIYQSVGDALRIVDASSGVAVRNNILLIDAGHDIFVAPDSQTGLVSDYNLLYQGPDANAHVGFFGNGIQDSLADWQAATGQEANGLVSEPQFIDINGADNVLGYSTVGNGFDGGLDDNFHLHRTSPAIDSAQAWFAPVVDREFFERSNDPGTTNTGSPDYTESSLGTSLFAETGVAQGWRSDSTSFALDLPITFPFYGELISRVYVSTEGFVYFDGPVNSLDGDNSDAGLRQNLSIAPLWDELNTLQDGDDIFVDDSAAGQVTIRWNASLSADASDVNFAVTLFDDGRLQFDYGPGNSGLTPTIGISRGDNRFSVLSSYNQVASLGDFPSLEFALSPGLTFSDVGAHEFQGDSNDVTPPKVVSTQVESHVAPNGTPFTHIHVNFSEPVDAIDANAPANYDLREDGVDGVFGTLDDVVFTLIPHYTFGSLQSTIDIVVAGGVLPTGNYRLRISGNTSIHDLAGNKLDGDDDGLEGGDAIAVNGTPTLTAIADREIDEKQLVSFNAQATDLDSAQTLTFSLDAGAPTGASITATGAFSWTPAENQDGTHRIVVRVVDNGSPQLNDIKMFTVTVRDVNEPPVLASPGNKSPNEKTAFNFTLSATDGDIVANVADSVSYSFVSGNLSGMTLDSATGAFSWTPTESQDGQAVVIFRAKDNHNVAGVDQTVTITVNEVNDPPVLANPGNKSLNEKTAVSFTLSATDGDIVASVADSISYSIVSGNLSGMTLDVATGAFSWTPTELQDGQAVVVFRAKDNHNAAGVDQTVTITVNEINAPPVLANPGNKSLNEKTALNFTLSATDGDIVASVADSISYSIVSGNLSGMTLNSATGAFSWTPTESQDGQAVVVFRAKDNHNAAGVDQTVTITVNEINDPPVLANPGNKSLNEKTVVNFTLSAADGDIVASVADSITYSFVSGNLSGMTLDSATGAFSWTPTESQDGQPVVVFRATDNHNAASAGQTVTITVNEVNAPPVLANPGNKSLNEKTVVNFTLSAADGDIVASVADAITYSIVSGNLSGMTLDSATGAFSWTPTESQDGQPVVVFRAKDNHNAASVDQTVTITVNEVNDPPVLANPGNKTVTELQLLAFSLSATDGDVVGGIADAVTYSIVTGSQNGMSLNDTTGAFSWTPTAAQGGDYVVTFRAADNHNGTHEQSVTMTVKESNQAPTEISVSNLSVDENAAGAVLGDVTVEDPDDGETHSFILSDNRFEIAAGKLKLKSSFALDFEATASLPLDITAIDSGTPGLMLTKSFTVIVNDVNDPPESIGLSNSTVRENILGATVGTLSATDQDAGQTHTFSTTDARFEVVGRTLKLKDTQFATGISVTIDVLATDSGTPPRAFTQSLVITLIPNGRPWQFSTQPFDTNADGSVAPLDALRIINQLNEPTILGPNGKLPDARPANSTLPYYDTNGDGFCTSNDVLRVINFLNSQLGEGEAEQTADVRGTWPIVDAPRHEAGPIASTARPVTRSAPVAPSPPSVVQNRLAHAMSTRTEPRRTELPAGDLDSAVDSILDEIADDITRAWTPRS